MSNPTTYFQAQASGPGIVGGVMEDFRRFWRSLFDPIQNAAGKFRKKRADYYETLADRLENSSGLTLKDLFERDAERYSTDKNGKPVKTPEGILAAYWARRYVDMGGDLAMTFEGTLPAEDVALIRAGEQAGSGALPSTLRDLARITSMIATAKSTFLSTTVIGFVALGILLAVLLSLPLFTVPLLRDTFGALPADQIPPRAQSLFNFSDLIAANAIVLFVLVAAGAWWVKWSLTNAIGPWRTKLDQFGIWRLYRDFQGAMFLAVLSTLVKRRNNSSTQLPDALAQLRHGASPWLTWHIDQMLANLAHVNSTSAGDNSTAIANSLNTGLIDQEIFWYFLDVQDGAGIAAGLQKTGARVEGPTLKRVARRAMVLRVILLGIALSSVFLITGWEGTVGSSLINALKNFYQS